MTKQEWMILAEKIASGTATETEIAEYYRAYETFQPADKSWNEAVLGKKQILEQQLRRAIDQRINQQQPIVRRLSWRTWSVAAAILILLAAVVYRNFLSNSGTRPEQPQLVQKKKSIPDIAPGGNKASLTLDDGSVIFLDERANGEIGTQGGSAVVKADGKVNYLPGKLPAGKPAFNTISTPRGGQYQVSLPDGTQVWLNAASSLRYPTAFTGKTRQVTVTGEAYFEVAKNAAMPFIVDVHGDEIQVLGTHFNVMAYADEAAVKTTLLEGAVRFVHASKTATLQPGQQSQLLQNGEIKLLENVDTDNEIAWKNGMFFFEKADIETVMRQLSRWYDVDVEYHNIKSKEQFFVDIPRKTNLSEVLKALELAGGASFQIEGKKIIVSP